MTLNNVLSLAKNRFLLALDRSNEKLAKQRNNAILPDGTTRIYHYHVRKTGGTSINHVFLSLDGLPSGEVYEAMLESPTKRFIGNRFVFVGWNKILLERGNYSFGFSHTPFDDIEIPDKTYTITCLRDPRQRLLSHYKMLLRYSERDEMSRGMRRELRWLDKAGGIIPTLRNMPKEHLLNQLFMFSTRLNHDEALENISTLDSVLMTETLGKDVRMLGDRMGLDLEPQHVRKDSREVELSDEEAGFLDELLEPEYEFLHNIRSIRTGV